MWCHKPVRTSTAQLRHLSVVRWRRARDRNPGARTNRALQLTVSSDINTPSRRTGPRHRRVCPRNRHNIPETSIDFIAHSCTWRKATLVESIVWAVPTETEGNVLVGARVRPLLCLAKLLAVSGALVKLHLSLVHFLKWRVMFSLEESKKVCFFGPTLMSYGNFCLAFSGIFRHIGLGIYFGSGASISKQINNPLLHSTGLMAFAVRSWS